MLHDVWSFLDNDDNCDRRAVFDADDCLDDYDGDSRGDGGDDNVYDDDEDV